LWIVHHTFDFLKFSRDSTIDPILSNSTCFWCAVHCKLSMFSYLFSLFSYLLSARLAAERFRAAAERGNLDQVQQLYSSYGSSIVNARGYYGRTALHSASFHGKLEVVKYLVQVAEANIRAVDDGGCTAQHCTTLPHSEDWNWSNTWWKRLVQTFMLLVGTVKLFCTMPARMVGWILSNTWWNSAVPTFML
jgi:Ankyrin repeats (3 copies)